MTQLEVKIVLFNPTMDEAKFAADVYVLTHNNPNIETWERIYCGTGGKTSYQSWEEAIGFIRYFHDKLADNDGDWFKFQIEYYNKMILEKKAANDAN